MRPFRPLLVALLPLLAPLSACSSAESPGNEKSDASTSTSGSTDDAGSKSKTVCGDCEDLPFKGEDGAPTIVAAVLKPSTREKSFYTFTITDPQNDITNLQIDEFSDVTGETLSSSNNFSCSSDTRDDCTMVGSAFTLYLPMQDAAAIRESKTWPIGLTATDAAGHSTSAKVMAKVTPDR